MENYVIETVIGVFVALILGLLGSVVLLALALRGISREMTTIIPGLSGIIQEQALAALLTSCNEDTLGKLPIAALDKIGKLRGIATPAERMLKPDKEQEKEKIAKTENDAKAHNPIPEGGVRLHVSL